MSNLVRMSMTLDQDLFDRLEAVTGETGAENRSQFIRDLLRTHLAERAWAAGGEVFATITLAYHHHQRGLTEKLVALQHDSPVRILAATHVHLDHHTCLEVLIARGSAQELHQLTGRLRQLKGVQQVAFSYVAPDHQAHGHDHQHPHHHHG